MWKLRVGSRGHITIPAEIRKKLGLKAGTKVLWELQGTDLIAHPVTRSQYNYKRNRAS